MPVVDAAAGKGVTYVDSTGELGFMTDVYLRHVHASCPIVPACGFDYVPGDLAAAVASADVDGAVKVTVAYDMRGVLPSRGTART